jgi:ribosomal protein S17E
MPRYRTRLYYKKLVDKIIDWLNSNIDKDNFNDNKEVQEAIACDSADLKQKIDLYLEGQDEF